MKWEKLDIAGYAPDLPGNTPGVIFNTDISVISGTGSISFGIRPTAGGFANGPFPESLSTAGGTSGAMDGAAKGGAVVYKTDGTTRIFAGTAAKLWEFDGAVTITDRSDTGYSATTTNTWSFCQLGDTTLAANLGNTLRYITAGGTFTNVGAAPVPKASVIVTCGPTSAPFVMAFDYDDGTNAYRDGWFNSGLSDATSGVAAWTTGTNSCANGRLLDDIPGPITAGVAYRDGVIAFKPSGMYLGSFGTVTSGWSWQRISSDVGCLGKNCVVNIEDTIYFADQFGLWMYDGSYPKRIPGYVQEWWARAVVQNFASVASKRHFAKIAFDKNRRNLWFLMPDNTSNCFGLVYHMDSKLWCPWDKFINNAGTVTHSDIIGFPRDSQQYGFAVTTANKFGYANFNALSSDPRGGWMVLGAMGSNGYRTGITGVRLNNAINSNTDPLSAFGIAYATTFDPKFGNSTLTTFTLGNTNQTFDGKVADRWLQPVLKFNPGDTSISATGHLFNTENAGV